MKFAGLLSCLLSCVLAASFLVASSPRSAWAQVDPDGDYSDWRCSRLIDTCLQMEQDNVPVPERLTLIMAWLEDNDVQSVSELSESAWLCTWMEHASFHLPPNQRPSPESLDAIRNHAAEQLRNRVPGADLDYEDALVLYEWAHDKLTVEEQAEQEQVLAELSLPTGAVKDWPFWRMEHTHRRMVLANASGAAKESLVIEWLENHDLELVGDLWKGTWLCQAICPLGTDSSDFSIRWTGFIKAPRDGDYTFSICPIDVGFEHGQEVVRQTMSVWIGDRQVLDSTTDGWTYQGTPVALSEDRLEPIRVEFSYAHYHTSFMDHQPAIAKLSWEGPGVAKSLVPAAVLSLPNGTGNGLLAEYEFLVDGQKQAVTQNEPMIDHAWFGTFPAMSEHADLRSRLVGRFCTLALDPDYLAKWDSQETAPSKHALWSAPALLDLMDSSEQTACVAELLARPILLQSHPQTWTMDFYWKCRVADLDQSLDLLGKWAQMHPDAVPEFGQAQEVDRERFIALARAMVWQYRPHLDLLEERYLEMPDGSCCLPVAYIVSYGRQFEGRIKEWIEKLDARLDDDAVAGDRRVNWLLARAQADEIRKNRVGRYYTPQRRALAGREWIEEASLFAQSEPVCLRAFKELATRQTVYERIDGARKVLDHAASRCSSAESTEALAQWRTELDGLSQAFQDRRDAQEALAQEAYLQRLRARYQRALNKGDSQATSRYENLITAAEENK